MKVKVGIVGYGTIGERVADGVDAQEDMEVVGVCDIAPTVPVRALINSGQRYALYAAVPEAIKKLEEAGGKVSGTIEDLIKEADIIVDATSPGIGAQNKEKFYQPKGIKALFEGGEKNEVADVVFNSYGNYKEGLGKNFIKLLSCNTTGICRTVLSMDKAFGVTEFTSLIIRRAADPSEIHKGPIDAAIVSPVPSHQARDFMIVAPWIKAVTVVVTVPTTHGHVNCTQVVLKQKVKRDDVLDVFDKEPRIKIFRIGEGFSANSIIFDYNRDLGKFRADMYEVPVWEETVHVRDNLVWWTQMIPQESIVIPENVDAIRAAMRMQEDAEEARKATNKYLGME